MAKVGAKVLGMRAAHRAEVGDCVWETKEQYPMYWDAAESVLKDLGIWDAEVYKGRGHRDCYDAVVLESEAAFALIKPGQWVKVIVIPQEEE